MIQPAAPRAAITTEPDRLTIAIPSRRSPIVVLILSIWSVVWVAVAFSSVGWEDYPFGSSIPGVAAFACLWALLLAGILFLVRRVFSGSEVIAVDSAALTASPLLAPFNRRKTFDVSHVSDLRATPLSADLLHHVLERHPKLQVIFAHFHFLSADLPRAAALMDRFPNVCFDLTPGTEMYPNFSKRPDETRDFFLKYQDRIILGSDFMSGGDTSPVVLVRQFLETDGEFTHQNLAQPVQGIALPTDSLKRIYAGNYRRITSPKPRPLDESLVLAELNRTAALQDQLGAQRNTARFFATLISGGIAADWEREPIFDSLML